MDTNRKVSFIHFVVVEIAIASYSGTCNKKLDGAPCRKPTVDPLILQTKIITQTNVFMHACSEQEA